MKSKALLICAMMLVISVIIITATPVSAAVNYDQEKFDPEEDVMRVRSGGAFKFMDSGMPGYSISQNVEITKMTSTFVDNILGDQVKFVMTVANTIVGNDDNYKYGFGVLADGDEYIVGYSDGVAVGFELGSGSTFIPFSDVSGNTLSLTVFINDLGDPQNEFEFSGGAIYTREEEYERFLDMAPDKLVLITEPSDQSTVNGKITVKGVVKDSIESRPSGSVRIKIDNGDWESVSGSTSWSYSLDTASLSDGDTHTISVEMEGETLENAQDSIEIFVYQDTNDETIYKTFNQKPDNPIVGSVYQYESMGQAQIIGIPIDISNEMTTKIEAFETITVDGTEYDTYRLYTETHGAQNLGYVSYENDVKRWTWKEDTNFGSPKERTISEGHVIGNPVKTVDSTTNYNPPLETHNLFDVTVGWNDNYKWTFKTNSKSKSNTTESGTTTDNPDLNENLQIAGECLFYKKSMIIVGTTYTNVYAIRTQYENPGVIIIEYYSVDLGVPVRIDTFDPSRNLLFSLGLVDVESPPTTLIIDTVTFDPSKPIAESDNKIDIKLTNLGTDSATNFKLKVMEGDQLVAEENIPTISGGSSENMKINWKPNSPGLHTLTITVSHSNNDVDEETVQIEVEDPSTDGPSDMMFFILLIVVIIIIAVLVVVMLKRRGGAKAGEQADAEAQAEAPVEAAPTTVAATTTPATAAPVTQAVAPQMNQETIQCPSCKNGFTIEYESKPVKVKCPNCGMEGVLN